MSRFLQTGIVRAINPGRRAYLSGQVLLDATILRWKCGADRGLFVDCGSNIGQGFSYFSRFYPPSRFDYVLIEPNPNCIPKLRQMLRVSPARAQLLEAAASTSEGHADLFGLVESDAGQLSVGASILADHNSALYRADSSRATKVPTLSFGALLAEKRKEYSRIVVKMDVEGAEYDILEDLLASGMINCVDQLYVEFHARYMDQSRRVAYLARERRIRQQLRARGIRFCVWV